MDGPLIQIIRKAKGTMDTTQQEQKQEKVVHTPPLAWQPQENEVCWMNAKRRDGKISTFRVRVLSLETSQDETSATVEVFPEFVLDQPLTRVVPFTDLAQLD